MVTYHKITAALTEGRESITLTWGEAVALMVIAFLLPWGMFL